MYTEEALVRLWMRWFGKEHIPSLTRLMSLGEFAMRMQEGCSLPNVAYPGHREFYYMQSLMPAGLLADVDLSGPPFSSLRRCTGAIFRVPD